MEKAKLLYILELVDNALGLELGHNTGVCYLVTLTSGKASGRQLEGEALQVAMRVQLEGSVWMYNLLHYLDLPCDMENTRKARRAWVAHVKQHIEADKDIHKLLPMTKQDFEEALK